MKHKGIHSPHKPDMPTPFMKKDESAWAQMSMRAPPSAKHIVMRVTAPLPRKANCSIVSLPGSFMEVSLGTLARGVAEKPLILPSLFARVNVHEASPLVLTSNVMHATMRPIHLRQDEDRKMLQLETILQSDRATAVGILEQHAPLLVPDLRWDWFRSGMQRVIHRDALPVGLDADFAVIEQLADGVQVQLIHVASPLAEILRRGGRSPELQQALSLVDRWQTLPVDSMQNILCGIIDDLKIGFVSCRIIIGDSHRQSDEERVAVRSLRTNRLRIRSFRWLLEKQALYPELHAVAKPD